MAKPDPTGDQFDAYRGAFDHFNAALFGGTLPRCLLNFGRHSRRTMGSFAPHRWRSGADRTHEISLNPDVLGRELEESMATLVHEMVHLWQREFGDPGRGGYHNREWGSQMEAIGLMPSDTGEPGGKKTGQQMTHYIIAGGPFALAFAAMPAGCRLPWLSDGPEADPGGPSRPDKVKYACDGCGAAAWGKPGLRLGCLDCDRPMDEQPARPA
jgi:hypothetical protein